MINQYTIKKGMLRIINYNAMEYVFLLKFTSNNKLRNKL